MPTQNISNTDDVIDVRDIIDRFEELRDELTERHDEGGFMTEFDDWIDHSRDHSEPIHAAWPEDGADVQSDIEELYKMRELLNDLRGNGGDHQWEGHWFPVTLIRDSYFEEYAQELAEDCGMVNKDQSWPNNCIDWGRAARELLVDYTSIEFDGVTYHTR